MRNFRQPTMLSDKPNWFDDFFSLAGSIFVKLTKYDVPLYALTNLTSFFSFWRTNNFRQPTMLSDMPNWFGDFFSMAGSIFVKLTTMFPYMPLLIWRVFFFLARAHLSDNCLSNNSLLCGLVYLVEPRTFTFSQLQHRTARQKIWLYTPINQLKKQLYSWDFIDVMWMVEKCVEGQNFHRTQSLYISQVELTWIMYLFLSLGI